MDLRGTGRSDAIDCPQLQSYRGPWKRLVALCGRQLGPLSERYGSAFAAADLVAVLDALGDRPDRPLRRLVRDVLRADVRRPLSGANADRHARRRLPDRQRRRVVARHEPRDRGRVPGDLCARPRLCRDAAAIRWPRSRVWSRRVGATPDRRVRHTTPTGAARSVRVNVDSVISLVTSAATTPTIYRELVAAARAALRANHPDPAPLLRLAAENAYVGGAGNIHTYSEGLATATGCNDYPQLWDLGASMPDRVSQYRAALDELRRDDPDAFAPFAIDDWVVSSATLFTSCIRWPVPTQHVPAKPPGRGVSRRPRAGAGRGSGFADLARRRAGGGRPLPERDVRRGAEHHARDGARRSPRTARPGWSWTSSGHGVVGDPTCVSSYPPIRLADRFPMSAAALGDRRRDPSRARRRPGRSATCWPDGGAWAGRAAWGCEAARSRPTATAIPCSGCATSAGSTTSRSAERSEWDRPSGVDPRHGHASGERASRAHGSASAGTPGSPMGRALGRRVRRRTARAVAGVPLPSGRSRRTSRRPRPASDRVPPAAARAPGRGRCVLATSGGQPARLPRTPPARSDPGGRAARGRDIAMPSSARVDTCGRFPSRSIDRAASRNASGASGSSCRSRTRSTFSCTISSGRDEGSAMTIR